MWKFFKIAVLVFVLLPLLTSAVAASGSSGAPELIVKYKTRNGSSSGRPVGAMGAAIAGFSGPSEQYRLVRVAPGADPLALRHRLAADPAVEYVEINHRARALAIPNDPLLPKQWNFTQVKAPQAWDLAGKPGKGVIVAVLDTGVAYEDRLVGNVQYRRIPDFNGTAFVPGYDFVDGNDRPYDEQGHGTHVAGVIAQTTDNGYGAAGLAWGARIMPVRVLDRYGFGTSFEIARAVRWAADHGAKVINLSLGIDEYSQTVEEALEYARNQKKATIVAAAGNGALNSGYSGGLTYPASSKQVISVGGVRYDKRRSAYSQYGGGLDLVAPGGGRLDQNNDGNIDGILQQTIKEGDPSAYGFYWITGTSQAAPHVSAAAAMLIARGVKNPDDIYRALTRSVEDLGAPGHDKYFGHGLLDIYGALAYRSVSTKWYFAEGSTRGRFDTRIHVNNPSTADARVRAYFSKSDGSLTVRNYRIEAGRRLNIRVGAIPGLQSTHVSTYLESMNEVGITAERTTYFDYRGRRGAHGTMGAASVSRKWFLAEGRTGRGFEAHVLIFNPNSAPGVIKVTFTKTDGSKIVRRFDLRARGRRRIVVNEIPALRTAEFATKVEVLSGPGVVVERSMYFNHGAGEGGHSTVGAVSPETKWLFAEGTTRGSFETWILVQNPAVKEALVNATFARPDGVTIVKKYRVPPGRRLTISVNGLPGMKNEDAAAKIESTNGVGVVAERAVYFNHGGRSGGHAALGAPGPARTWYFADGFTGGNYETWLLLYNPRPRGADINIHFMLNSGKSVTKTLTVPPRSRRSVSVGAYPALASARVSAKISSTNGVPIVAEKAVYFNDDGRDGGYATMGYAP